MLQRVITLRFIVSILAMAFEPSRAVSAHRVLCLQGKGGDGVGMFERLQSLRATMGEEWEFKCMDAPHELGRGQRGWWMLPPGERSYTAQAYEGDLLSIAQVEAEWATGDYSALIGFSQGAMLAAIVSARGLLGKGNVRPTCLVLLG